MRACVKPEWKGGDAYIIGGGASLRDFDFSWLKGRNTIGANDAFRLGPSLCARAIFCDWKWWKVNKWELEQYAQAGGVAYSLCDDTARFNLDWLHQFSRMEDGGKNPTPGISDRRDTLGMNYNTGAAAVNLAYLLGVQRVFLLGFDMAASAKHMTTHWHNHRGNPTPPESYERFIRGFEAVAKGMAEREVQVYNVTDGSSKLPYFRRVTDAQMKETAR